MVTLVASRGSTHVLFGLMLVCVLILTVLVRDNTVLLLILIGADIALVVMWIVRLRLPPTKLCVDVNEIAFVTPFSRLKIARDGAALEVKLHRAGSGKSVHVFKALSS